MAYAAIVSLAQTIDKILDHYQYPISLHQEAQIRSVRRYTVFLQVFVEDFPEKANSFDARIRDVANQAEDIIEYFVLQQIQSRYRLMKPSKYTPFRYDFHELKKVRKEIASIVGKAMDIEKSFRIENVRPNDFYTAASSSSRLITTTIKNDDDMVGFDDDLIEIKTLLCGESSKLQVIPIVGMGGIGKTTLARNAYDDPLIMEHFQILVWVTVSQEYNAQEIISSLLVSVKERFEQSNDYSSMEEKVYKGLKGRRYLIVMDDIWSTDVWDDVRKIFPDDHNGSRVMLTTRLSDVAAYAGGSSSLAHEMRFMDEDQSWNLLRQKVFKHEYFPRELEDIGKEIARSCRGLPLAIVLIAGLLSTIKTTRASWEEIAKNVNSVVATKDGQFEKILSLSYTHLPHHLRPCFLYMGVFPEDHKIHVSKITKLWLAEGFLKPNIGSKSSEEVAEEYLEDLIKRSLVLVTNRKSSGKIKICSLHDLVRDLCMRQAHQEKFLRHVRNGYVGKTILERIKNKRRVSISNSYLDCYANIDASTIRTIVCFKRGGASLGSLGSFRLLRVFDVVDGNVNSLPDQVFELFHLRYLAFDCRINIPKTISNLENLETLIIHPRKKWGSNLPCFVSLPSETWRLPKLRHLVCFYFDVLPNPGSAFGLENLQTLSAVKNLRCTKRTLQMIPNLKKLGIFYSGDKYSPRLHNLVSLHQLEKLKIVVGPQIMHSRLNAIFPRTLKKLTLSGWRLPWKDMTTSVGSLPNLEVLKLRNYACKGGEWETCEGGFVRLKYLLIDQSDLRDWITESRHFPSLKCISFRRCWDLIEIPDGIGEIQTLERIVVHFCCKSLAESARRIQEEQQSWGNDALQVESEK